MAAEKWSQFTEADNPEPDQRVPWLQDQGDGEDNVVGTWSQIVEALFGPASQMGVASTDSSNQALPTVERVEQMIGSGETGLLTEIQVTDPSSGNIRIRWAETYSDVVAYTIVLLINDYTVAWPSSSSDPWIELPWKVLDSPLLNRLGVAVTATTVGGTMPIEYGYASLPGWKPILEECGNITISLAETLVTNAEREAAGPGFTYWPDGAVGIANVEGTVVGTAPWTRWVVDEGETPWMTSPSTIPDIDPTEDYSAGGPIYYDDGSNRLIMVWHGEDHTVSEDAFWSFLGMAVSDDAGLTWTNLGRIITPNLPAGDPLINIGPIEVGSGPMIVMDDGYMYVYFRDYIDEGTSYRSTAMGVARCLLTDVVSAAVAETTPVFNKFYNDVWTELGLGGLSTDLLPDETGTVSFDICYLEDENLYLRVATHGFTTGFSASCRTSPDLRYWTPRKQLWPEMRAERIYLALSNPDQTQQQRSIAGDEIQVYRTRSERSIPHRWDYAELERLTMVYDRIDSGSTVGEWARVEVPESRNVRLSDIGAIVVCNGPTGTGPTEDIDLTITADVDWPLGAQFKVFSAAINLDPFATFETTVTAGAGVTFAPQGDPTFGFTRGGRFTHMGDNFWQVEIDANQALDDLGWVNTGSALETTLPVMANEGSADAVAIGATGFGPGFISAGPTALLMPQTSGFATTSADVPHIRTSSPLPTNGVVQSLPRSTPVGNLATLVSGTLIVCAVDLLRADVISNVGWHSRTTAGASLTNQWAVVLDVNRQVVAVSADAGSAAWAGSSPKVFAMGTPYVVPSNGIYYLGLMVAGGTVPTLAGQANASAAFVQLGPPVVASSSTGQTTPPSVGATMAAFSNIASGVPYCWAT